MEGHTCFGADSGLGLCWPCRPGHTEPSEQFLMSRGVGMESSSFLFPKPGSRPRERKSLSSTKSQKCTL